MDEILKPLKIQVIRIPQNRPSHGVLDIKQILIFVIIIYQLMPIILINYKSYCTSNQSNDQWLKGRPFHPSSPYCKLNMFAERKEVVIYK